MKALIFLKILVIFLTLAIVGAFAFIIIKVTDNQPKIKQNIPTIATTPNLQFGEIPIQMTDCTPYLCVLTNTARVLVLDIEKNTIINTIDLNTLAQ